MLLRRPDLSAAFRTLKVIMGSALVFMVFLTGVTIGGCGDGIFCPVGTIYKVYAMRLDLWSGVAAVTGLALLISALKDLLISLDLSDLLERDIESTADLE
ncbi:MAG: hypothetical protein AAFX56_08010 [Pseudomonadota bacterium]